MVASISICFACLIGMVGVCMFWRHESMQAKQAIMLVVVPVDAITSRSSSGPSWAIATLITVRAKKALGEHAITYIHQAMLLGFQMAGGYPDVPLLAMKQGRV